MKGMIHICTIQKRTMGAENAYGKSTPTWANTQTGLICRFYYPSDATGAERQDIGEVTSKPLQVMLENTVTIAEDEYRVVTASAPYAGTYDVKKVFPRGGATGVHHYEAVLRKVQP